MGALSPARCGTVGRGILKKWFRFSGGQVSGYTIMQICEYADPRICRFGNSKIMELHNFTIAQFRNSIISE
jgi:hypothetical protein